ncbi:hypothetical protein RI129_004602 [Pyrocoelia pectoralis]|uniref:Cytochrome P450 n=1 Tax=Pyrocoelia pectoralis TaxID=417401 RepID=A0AAN7VH99_9COLE
MSIVGAVLVAPVLILLIRWFYLYYGFEKYIKNIPGPTPLPIIGNLHQFGAIADELTEFLGCRKKYGDVFKVRFSLDVPNIFISNRKVTEGILKSNNVLDKSTDYNFFHNWLGAGLLTSTDEKWKMHRKMLTPAFHFKILEGFVDTFNKFGDILLKRLGEEVGRPSVDIYPHIDIIVHLRHNLRAQEDSNSEYVNYVKEILRIVYDRTSMITKAFDLTYLFTSDFSLERKVLRVLHNFTNGVIASRKKELAQNGADSSESDTETEIKKRLSFLDTMLQYKEEGGIISDESIREEVDTFMFEGHDTTASAISFTLFCLANNPHVQETVIQELKSIFGDHKADASSHDLNEMKYLEMVIKESLRLYPPVPLIGRHILKDTEIDGYSFPKGVDVTIFVHALHKDPTVFPNPEKFDPERFSFENQNKGYAYIPFSAGPRNCIGQKFAMLEMKSVISKILRNFELLPSIPEHNPKLTGAIILKSQNGLCVRLKKRKC